MKKLLLCILAATLCLSLCSCASLLQNAKSLITGEAVSKMPDDFIAEGQNETFSYEIYESYIKVVKYIGEATEITIPGEIEGKPVTTVGSLCFHQTTAVTDVKIPDSVTTIEANAFYYADSLITITVPDNVTSVGSRAFAWCTALESVSLGKGIEEIPEYCFNSCKSLTTVYIPENIKRIGLRAFSYCEKLEDFVVPENVSKVGERAFEGCNGLKFITISNSSAELGQLVFNNAPDVVVIGEKDSNIMNYCKENGLRWSTSKDVEAVILEKDTSESETEESKEESK